MEQQKCKERGWLEHTGPMVTIAGCIITTQATGRMGDIPGCRTLEANSCQDCKACDLSGTRTVSSARIKAGARSSSAESVLCPVSGPTACTHSITATHHNCCRGGTHIRCPHQSWLAALAVRSAASIPSTSFSRIQQMLVLLSTSPNLRGECHAKEMVCCRRQVPSTTSDTRLLLGLVFYTCKLCNLHWTCRLTTRSKIFSFKQQDFLSGPHLMLSCLPQALLAWLPL